MKVPMPSETYPGILGLDIGGANLKAAHADGPARSQPFALWKNPRELSHALGRLLSSLPRYDRLAVTMTGELCDCFATRREGVQAILDAVEEVAEGKPVRVWQTSGRFATLAAVRADPLQAAAANWLALAVYAGRFVPAGPAVLMDIGSTTTDIVPLCDGRPVPRGRTDAERLQCQELVYTGVRRTPLCALLGAAGAAEWFATTHAVYLLLGDLAEDANDADTPDGRPATRAAAHARLARMICADTETTSEAERVRLAEQVQSWQCRLLGHALAAVASSLPERPATFLLSGSGEFLARKVLALLPDSFAQCISLGKRLGPEISQAACAHAVAVLAREQDDGKA
jgi:probable H4MPT-linked C1 transfer pathway protein